MTICTPLYRCHRWDCKDCSGKKLYWLYEQAKVFARHGAYLDFNFIVLKGFRSAEHAFRDITDLIKSQRANKARYNAKLEYFYSISNHGYSGWHIHLLINRDVGIDAAYRKPAESLIACCLYIVDNLKWSLRADYGTVRRYGASSLLNKQNMKQAYKTRVRLFNVRTRLAIVKILIPIILKALSGVTVHPRTDHQALTDHHPLTPATDHNPNKIRPPPIRPPPYWDKLLIIRSLSSKR